MKYFIFYVLLMSLLLFGCSSKPDIQPAEEARTVAEQAVSEPLPAEAQAKTTGFDPGKISHEFYENTKTDVQQFIKELSSIISKNNYEGWKANCSDDYFKKISSAEYLKAVSEQPTMKALKIVLKTPQDYFKYVVKPSRENRQADDIEFIGTDTVKVFSHNSKNDKMERLYEIKRSGNTWKIIN